MPRSEDLRLKLAWLRALGVPGLATLVAHRLLGHRCAYLARHPELFEGRGLELGGPSPLFMERGYAPVYTQVKALDNVNFFHRTRWEGDITEGATFRFRPDAEPGRQFVHEATELASIATASYDFLLSCHMLEHTANPLKALLEWRRVLRPGGTLLLVLPHKDGTFDHRRPVTPLSHMVADFERDVGEDDRTHFDEVLRLHDLRRDHHQASMATFRAWVEGNTANRGVHHHVFDSLSAAQLLDRAGFGLLCVEPAKLESIFLFARNPLPGETPDNRAFTQAQADFLRRSPFRSDRRRSLGAPAG